MTWNIDFQKVSKMPKAKAAKYLRTQKFSKDNIGKLLNIPRGQVNTILSNSKN